jgi:hypothetical protein
MAADVRREAEARAPWKEWKVVLFDTRPQLGYYLEPEARPRRLLTNEELAQALKDHPRTVVVTYVRYAPRIESQMSGWTAIQEKSTLPWELGQPKKTPQAQVAYLPH